MNRNEAVRSVIYDRITKIRTENALLSSSVRILFHFPIWPTYIFTYLFGIFGYYNSRLSSAVLDAARAKIKTIGVGDLPISIRSKWYKPLEYYVINRSPLATSRMYNYLVISGLFRSMSIIFLLSLWAQIYYWVHYLADGDWFIEPFLGSDSSQARRLEYGAMTLAYVFSLFSYIKFKRRYAEEAIFAFVFGE